METNSFGGETKLSAWLHVSTKIDWRFHHCQGQVDHKVYESLNVRTEDTLVYFSFNLLAEIST